MMKNLCLLILFALIPGVAFSQSRENETYRPVVHFSPSSGWMSDPNGLVYYDGEYHLFYQHIPNGGLPGPHWGHAVSTDLLHWQELPIALYPDSLGFIFSGCCVFDRLNSSGLGTKENPPLVAIFTYHDPAKEKDGTAESQAIAYSTDKGRTWTKYRHNPVIRNPGIKDFRDPKVVWDHQAGRWLMALAGGPVIKFYGSDNLIDWEYLSEFGEGYGVHTGPWECPDFFPVKVKGGKETKWVLLVSVVDFTDTPNRLATATQYFIGDFDGRTFTTQQKETLWVDHGKDCYAGVTFDNAPDGRRIFVAWMHSHQYAGQARKAMTQTWSGSATFPRNLDVVKTNGSYRLDIQPVAEIAQLYGAKKSFKKIKVNKSVSLSGRLPFKTVPVEINLNFDTSKLPGKYGIRLKNNAGEYVTMGYERDKQQFYVDRTHATGIEFHKQFSSTQYAFFKTDTKTMQWRVLVDAMSVEWFVGNHTIVFTDVLYPSEPFDTIELFSEEGTIDMKKGNIIQLKPIIK